MSEERRSGRFVTPGERIGVIEEFIPSHGTYVKDGVIYSSSAGYLLIDAITRKVSIYPATHGLYVPKVGSIVVGYVMSTQSAMAFMRIIRVGKKNISGFFSGVLHISDVDVKFTKDISDALKVSDLVRAKVISEINKIFHLSTKGENLGVIFALCSKCGGTLRLKSKRGMRLQCEKCGNVETRKIASDYGSGNL